ncbi:MAG: NADH:ubiquinone reductase (Na(+)-transporting) subunit A, partial [Woeseiaceae bacterium]
MRIKTKKGLNVPVSGVPEPVVDDSRSVRTVALLGRDYVGLKPRMMVKEGDSVSLGDALFVDKRDPVVA